MQKVFKLFYGLNLEHKDHALKGWNWGKGEFGKAELAFNVQNRPAFEIPYSEISNTNLAGKIEVAVEFSLPAGGDDPGTNGHLGGARSRGRKSGAGKDQLVEMRFYIPGTTTKKEVDEDGEDKSANGSEDEEQHNAANLFYETLMDKAEIGEVAGDTFATFLDVLHLTPRWVMRFRIDNTNCTDGGTEDALVSTCMKTHSDYAARPTTTRYLTKTSRNSCFYRNQTIYIHLSPSAWIHRYGKVRRDTPSLSCNSNGKRRLQ